MSIPTIDIRVKLERRRVRAVAALVLLFVLGSGGVHAEVPQKLVDALASPSQKVRIVAVASLANIKAPEARRLIEPLLRDPAPAVRAEVVNALGRIGDPTSIPTLEALTGENDPAVRKALARVLSELRARVVFVFAPAAQDYTGRGTAATQKLNELMRAQLPEKLGPGFLLHQDPTRTGYGAAPFGIRSIQTHTEEGTTFVDVKCEVTVVEMPGNILRGALNATASAGVEGKLNKKLEEELTLDAVAACAPELAGDFANFIRDRIARRGGR